MNRYQKDVNAAKIKRAYKMASIKAFSKKLLKAMGLNQRKLKAVNHDIMQWDVGDYYIVIDRDSDWPSWLLWAKKKGGLEWSRYATEPTWSEEEQSMILHQVASTA